MSVKETCERLCIPEVKEVYVNPLRLAIDYEFKRIGSAGKKNYRTRAVERCVRNGVSFHSEFNTVFELMSDLIMMKCPKCGEKMKHSCEGSGNANSYSTSWSCKKCGVKVSLSMPCDGINVTFESDGE